MLRALVFLALALCCAVPAAAQVGPVAGPGSDPVESPGGGSDGDPEVFVAWELLGTEGDLVYVNPTEALAFRHGPHPSGALDTLHTLNVNGFHRLALGDGPDAAWERTCDTGFCSTDYVETTKEGHLLIGTEAGPTDDGARSLDGGRTFEEPILPPAVTEIFQSTIPALGGAVYLCNGAYCSRSFEGGAFGTWELGEPMGGQPDALDEMPPSAMLPEGRLLGGAWAGVAYSDDGGMTWTPSSLWGQGRFVVPYLAVLPVEGHPYGGLAFAGVTDFGGGPEAVWRSADGGETWEPVMVVEPGRFGVEDPNWIAVVAAPGRALGGEPAPAGGVVFAGIRDVIGGPSNDVGPVVASADGGETWALVTGEGSGWGGFGVNAFEVGRDGRVYAATDRGIWRTADALPVAAEGEASEGVSAVPAQIEVYPNPVGSSSGRVATVEVSLAEAAAVRVAVYDVLGREVAVLHEGPLGAGAHSVGLDQARLPAGVYVVRATGDGFTESQRVTVVR